MQERNIKKLIGNATKMKEKFEKTQEKVRNNQDKRRQLMIEQAEHFKACETLKKELPTPFDSNFHTELNFDDGKNKIDQFKFHLNKIKEYQEKIDLLKQEAVSMVNKSEKIIIKEIAHGQSVMNKEIDEIGKQLSDDEILIEKIQEVITKVNKLGSK